MLLRAYDMFSFVENAEYISKAKNKKAISIAIPTATNSKIRNLI